MPAQRPRHRGLRPLHRRSRTRRRPKMPARRAPGRDARLVVPRAQEACQVLGPAARDVDEPVSLFGLPLQALDGESVVSACIPLAVALALEPPQRVFALGDAARELPDLLAERRQMSGLFVEQPKDVVEASARALPKFVRRLARLALNPWRLIERGQQMLKTRPSYDADGHVLRRSGANLAEALLRWLDDEHPNEPVRKTNRHR